MPPDSSQKAALTLCATTLREQEEWLRVTLSNISDAVIITGVDRNIAFLNSVAHSLTGWSQEEAKGVSLESVFKIIDEQSRLPIENPAVRAFTKDNVVGLANHSVLIARDGTERPIQDNAAPIRNEVGEVAGAVLVFRDISERRQYERAARQALEYAEEIITTLREPFLVLDRDLKIRTANGAFYHAFHASEEETVGRFFYELGNGQWDIPRLRGLLGEVIPTEIDVENFEVEHDFPDIGLKSMLLNARRFPPEGDNPHLVLLAIEDITDRKRTEAVMRESEIQYRRLFQAAKDGILILDASTGKIIDVNPFMSGLLGYERHEFIGKELWQIGLFREVAENRAAYLELKEHGYVRYDHLPLKTKGGREVEVEVVSNIYVANGHEVAQCNIRDITERRRLERQTQEQALAVADLHRRKDEFLAMLSHELRNPLSPILNAVHLLRLQGEESLIQQEARSVIERQVGQLTRLIDDLLEVSRITSGRVRLQLDHIDIRCVVEFAVESVRPLISRHRHELSVSLPSEPVYLRADSTRLEQVVVNLLNNAAKYTKDGGQIWLTVRQEGVEVLLTVRDTGAGIAPEVLPHVFDLFTQAEQSLDRAQGGLGIGLSLVKQLVELHRGTVEAHSAGLGQGAEFTVRLPMLLAPVVSRYTTKPVKPIDPLARGSCVLVVDDNEDSANMMARLFARSGHEVHTAYTGMAALQVAADCQPDVVLLDIGLPEINGYEVARRLRRIPQLKSVKIVAITGYGQESDIRLADEAGFDAHLVKPVEFMKVGELIKTLLTRPDPV